MKVETVANYNQLLALAKRMRTERDRARDLAAQREEQRAQLVHLETRRGRLQSQLAESRQANAGATGEGLLRRAEDSIRVHRYIIDDKLSGEIRTKTESLALGERVLAGPKPTAGDLQGVQQKVAELRALDKDTNDRGRRTCAERLSQLRQETRIRSSADSTRAP